MLRSTSANVLGVEEIALLGSLHPSAIFVVAMSYNCVCISHVPDDGPQIALIYGQMVATIHPASLPLASPQWSGVARTVVVHFNNNNNNNK